MDTYTINKYAGGLLAAVLLVVLLGKIGGVAVQPDKLEKQVYSETPLVQEGSTATGQKEPKEEIPLPVLLANASVSQGERVAKKCTSCHSFENGGANKIGPNLYNVLGSPMAGVAGFAYSSALKGMGGEWGYKELDTFLKNPRKYVSGTKMSFAGLKKPEDRAKIIVYMRSYTDQPPPLPQPE